MSEQYPEQQQTQASVFTFPVRSYESDAWGQVSAAGMLRYLEQAAISAASERGFGREFHTERNSTWMIRRMILHLLAPARPGDSLRITTWLSNLERVRGGREYRVVNERTGASIANALAEWVYLDRTTLRPLAIPHDLSERLRVPGKPLGDYAQPQVAPLSAPVSFSSPRTVEWHECDSHGHVNNSVYADWLDEGVRGAASELGYRTGDLKAAGLQLRGVHYRLDYKRGALPEERLNVETRIVGAAGSLCAIEQSVATEEGGAVLSASSIYAWLDNEGASAEPPEGWLGAR